MDFLKKLLLVWQVVFYQVVLLYFFTDKFNNGKNIFLMEWFNVCYFRNKFSYLKKKKKETEK